MAALVFWPFFMVARHAAENALAVPPSPPVLGSQQHLNSSDEGFSSMYMISQKHHNSHFNQTKTKTKTPPPPPPSSPPQNHNASSGLGAKGKRGGGAGVGDAGERGHTSKKTSMALKNKHNSTKQIDNTHTTTHTTTPTHKQLKQTDDPTKSKHKKPGSLAQCANVTTANDHDCGMYVLSVCLYISVWGAVAGVV